jgi:hypothetical protein
MTSSMTQPGVKRPHVLRDGFKTVQTRVTEATDDVHSLESF